MTSLTAVYQIVYSTPWRLYVATCATTPVNRCCLMHHTKNAKIEVTRLGSCIRLGAAFKVVIYGGGGISNSSPLAFSSWALLPKPFKNQPEHLTGDRIVNHLGGNAEDTAVAWCYALQVCKSHLFCWRLSSSANKATLTLLSHIHTTHQQCRPPCAFTGLTSLFKHSIPTVILYFLERLQGRDEHHCSSFSLHAL